MISVTGSEGARKQTTGQYTTTDWDDVVFEIDLLKSQEINLDYILELIFDHNKQHPNKETLKEEVRRLIRASLGTVPKKV
jgi:type I restriction enzyme R subunit